MNPHTNQRNSYNKRDLQTTQHDKLAEQAAQNVALHATILYVLVLHIKYIYI